MKFKVMEKLRTYYCYCNKYIVKLVLSFNFYQMNLVLNVNILFVLLL